MVCLLWSTFVVQKCFHKNIPIKFACAGEKPSTFKSKNMCGHAWQCDHSCDTACYYLVLFRVCKNWGLFKSSMQLSGFVFGRTKTEDYFELLECLLQQINVAFLMQLYYNLQKDFSWLTSFYCHRMSIVHRERYKEIAVELNSRIVMLIWIGWSSTGYTHHNRCTLVVHWYDAKLAWFDTIVCRGCDDDGLVFFLHEIGQRITYNCHRKKLIIQICNNETAIICFPVCSGTCNTRSPMWDKWASEAATPGQS